MTMGKLLGRKFCTTRRRKDSKLWRIAMLKRSKTIMLELQRRNLCKMRKKNRSTLDAKENVGPMYGTFSDFVFANKDSAAEPDFELRRKSSGLRRKKKRITVCKDDLRLDEGTCSIVDMYVKESTRVLEPGSKLGTKLCIDASDAVPELGVESAEELGEPIEGSTENDTFQETRKKKREKVDIQKPAEHRVLEEEVLSKKVAEAAADPTKERIGLENLRKRKKIVILALAAEPATQLRLRFECSTKELTEAAEAATDPFKERVGSETLRNKKFGLEVVSEIKPEPVMMDQRGRFDGEADLLKERPGSKKLKKKKTIQFEATSNYKSGSGREQGLGLESSTEDVAEAAGDRIKERSGLVKSKKRKKTVSELKVELGENPRSRFEVSPDVENSMFKEQRKNNSKKIEFEELTEQNITITLPEINIEDDLYHLCGRRGCREDSAREYLKYGKYTSEEDEKIENGVYNYMRMQGLERIKGLQMILRCKEHKELRGCWLDIAKTVPHRSRSQIYARAHRLLGDYRGRKRGRWSVEEKEALNNLYITYGNNWKEIATRMDRSRKQCVNQWRRLRYAPTRKAGQWGQDEIDELAKLVRRSLKKRPSLAPTRGGRHLRDNILWECISERMQRFDAACADKWYRKLISPMVFENKWDNEDDRLLLRSLIEVGDSSEDAVHWDSLLDHRDGATCMKRWAEMCRFLGGNRHAPFEDKLKLLAKRYAPDLVGIDEEEE